MDVDEIVLTSEDAKNDGLVMMMPMIHRKTGCWNCQEQFDTIMTIGYDLFECPNCGLVIDVTRMAA